jgi:hypothetical protein
MKAFEAIDNRSLIQNGLRHIEFEIGQPKPSMFRVAREAHLILYRSMIEALKGSANLAVVGQRPKERRHQYKLGDEPFKEIHKEPVSACRKAWRFSRPVECQVDESEEVGAVVSNHDDFLVSFYDALAMIQSECFMQQFVKSNVVAVFDDEMKALEWLHEDIRNEYEHFVPSGYSAPVRSLVRVSILGLRLSSQVLFESGNVFQLDKGIRGAIDMVIQRLQAISDAATTE